MFHRLQMRACASLLLAALLPLSLEASGTTPEQIHLSFGRSTAELVVTWVSFEPTPLLSIVQYGPAPNATTQSSAGPARLWTEDRCQTNRSIHYATFPCGPNEVVYYRVSSDGSVWSTLFVTKGAPAAYPIVFAAYGDAGVNSQVSSIPLIIADTNAGRHQWIFAAGDHAYNMDDECGGVGDMFMNAVEPAAAVVPYIFGVGNHETDLYYTYANFLERMAGQTPMANASGSPSVHWFSFEIGPMAMFYISADAWIYPFVYELAEPQWLWLNASLAAVDRNRTPWVFVWGHRAMYCFKTTDPECNSEAETLRNGFLGFEWGLEELLHRYSVDLYLAGHTHHYEREWPSYNGSAVQKDYVNPGATVHIQSGIAGVDGYDPFNVSVPDHNAFYDPQYNVGYGRITLHNDSHMTWEQRYAVNGSVLDSFTISQAQHTFGRSEAAAA